MTEIVIGIDGGGTTTRVVVADLNGRILATVRADAASPNKTAQAQENVQNAIRDAVAQAGHTLPVVAQLVAGIAGLDAPEDQAWAEQFTALPGLDCPRLHVNDAVVAHAGALRSRPGIIAISGTGSIVFGVTEAGRHIRNYDFGHYAHSSARHLSYDAVYRLLAGDFEASDGAFKDKVLAFWQAGDLDELRERGTVGFVPDHHERGRRFGQMAPLVTDAALNGVALAQAVCDTAAHALAIGIRLVGSCFIDDSIEVALIGSVAQNAYMRQSVASTLAQSESKRHHLADPAFSSEAGAVLMALARQGVMIDEAVLAGLRANDTL